MKAVVIGCGRVGSAVSLQLAADGWDVTAVDEDEEALGRLGKNWKGGFVVGHVPSFRNSVDPGRERGHRDGIRPDSTAL